MTTADLPLPAKHYRYLDFVMVGFVTVLLCSNLIGPAKQVEIALPLALPLIGNRLLFGAGNIFFPLGYIFGDILTEVYGYARARKVIWAGFGAMLFATIMTLVVIHLPGNRQDTAFQVPYQDAVKMALGGTWRIALASLIAYWAGDFANSYVLAKMKVFTKGRFLWTRTIGSTIVGQGLDSLIFYPLAFYGVWQEGLVLAMCVNWGFKVGVEVLFTPVTYLIVNVLKRAEHEDHYDVNTNFTPFSIEDE
jgi:queuosine precursor transporter